MSETNYSPVAQCRCGKSFEQNTGKGPKRKYCGNRCRDAAAARAPRLTVGEREFKCAHCAEPFVASRKRMFCNPKCRDEAHRRAAGIQPARTIPKCKCQHCGVTFKPKKGDRSTYCTRECAYADMAATPSCSVYTAYCPACSSPFVSRRMRTYCSEACHSPKYVSTAPTSKKCKACGDEFAPPPAITRQTDFCSVACKKSAKDAQKRVGKSKRRAMQKAAHVEAVDPYKVFDRDKWRCQLCGRRAPKSKRGTCDDDAPELDHIQPLSKGGEHSYRNTQCACRRCNQAKADTPRGQLLMFG